MAKEMLINVSEGEECRIALLDNGHLEELYMERTSSTSHVGNIYKGRVTNVEPSIQAAFIDFGLGRNGFLHISDLMPSYFGRQGEDVQESVGRKMSRRDRPPIQRCLRRGDEIVVQIIKEGIGTKGPTLSTYLSIPGRILVMMPGMAKMGVSRKIEDDEERRRLRLILDSLKPPDEVGFIIRTAGVGRTKAEIQRDLTYLTRLWQTFAKKRDSGPAPMELYTEGDLVSRTVRDVFTTDVDRVVVDNKDVAKRVKEVIKLANPRTKNKVELYDEPIPLFHQFKIEHEIELMHSRHVPLPSGGSLVIDSTEAVVAIDVNSGKFRDHSDAEMTAFKTDMEAADEIPRQLKLRDLGGVIICDFIDLRYERHRRELDERLHHNFARDRAKTKVLRMSQFGIIEITRQRMRPSLKRSIYFDCPHCKGAGLVKTPESMSLDAMRRLAVAAQDKRVVRVEMAVSPDVAFYLENKKRRAIADLEDRAGKPIAIRTDSKLALDEVKLILHDERDGLVYLEELGMAPEPPPGAIIHQHGRGGRRDGRRPPPPRRNEPRREERASHSIDDVDDDVDQREEHMDEPAGDEATSSPEPIQPREPDRVLPPPPAAGGGSGGGFVEGDAPHRRRRRRGRRGRGGRGRGGENQNRVGENVGEFDADLGGPAAPDLAASDVGDFGNPPPESEEPMPEPEINGNVITPEVGGNEEGVKRRRRRRRGGRGRNRGGGGGNAPMNGPRPPASQRQLPAPIQDGPVVRTGSTDRHLAGDEPIAPQPLSRPHSVRDLDAIPDDFE
jgi:ribonuclease E